MHLGDVATITAESTTLLKGLKEGDFQEYSNQWRSWDSVVGIATRYGLDD
jgi:hypothetical protein